MVLEQHSLRKMLDAMFQTGVASSEARHAEMT
jgi:hypothetical protein